jgi:Holliday junction resolvase RusA-like endonuclease
MLPIEFVIPKRPVSLQAKAKSLRKWKSYVSAEAAKVYAGVPLSSPPLRCTIVYLSGDSPADIDNIIKPIQDALINILFEDDFIIYDVDCHRRSLTSPLDIISLPEILQKNAIEGNECVYVRISKSEDLREYL